MEKKPQNQTQPPNKAETPLKNPNHKDKVPCYQNNSNPTQTKTPRLFFLSCKMKVAVLISSEEKG